MALTLEWRKRIDHWLRVIPTLFYTPLAEVALEGFETAEQLTPEAAQRRRFHPMPPGTSWGPKWGYAWFRATVALPKSVAGQRVVLKGAPGGEALVFVDGAAAGALDNQHDAITLTRQARAGKKYALLIEAYGGHGPMVSGGGPVPHGVATVPEPGATQRVVGRSTLGIWQEAIYQLWIDAMTLLKLRDTLPADSLRVQEIDAGLRDFTTRFDPELPADELPAVCQAARRRLAPLLACVNGSTAPELWCFGHSHIDVAWLWPLQETERKCGRTFSTALALMEEYPEYRFLQSQPHLLRMARQRYPELYARIRRAARRGQWMSEGGMWVEADTNLSGGEALIRQCLHGRRFFHDEFGVDCEMLWLPDVFGYSGALPQILKGCGLKYFSTQKIYWNYNGGENFPYVSFWWEGIDGTRLLSHFHNDYNSQSSPTEVADRWNLRVQKDGIRARLMPFGYGDGGGGATRDHLEYLRRERDLEGLPRTRIDSPVAFFHELERTAESLPVYVGELYFQCHRGTYTTQAANKRGNRVCEFALREAELWGCAARARTGFAFTRATLDEAWKGVLLNQFHDIIPGSSIRRVYEESCALYATVEAQARSVRDAAQAALAPAAPGVMTLFNALSWPRAARIALPAGWRGAVDAAGSPLPVQPGDGALLVAVPSLPPCGWTTLREAAPAPSSRHALRATPRLLENERLRVSFNARGEITTILDKESGAAVTAGPCNQFRMYKDVPAGYDAWDLDSTYRATPVSLDAPARLTVEAAGPLLAVLRIERPLHHSRLVQRVKLAAGSRRIDFETEIDWQERHKLLKVIFTTDIHANEAMHEIQFGHLARPNHESRPFDQDRFEVSMHKWTALVEPNRGAAVLNDGKYGCHVSGREIGLTLLRSPLAPDMTADLGLQRGTFSFYAWNGPFATCDVVREGYELNAPVTAVAGDGGTGSLLSVDNADVIVETVKPAEDDGGDLIVRLYESKRAAARCTLRIDLPFRSAWQTDMLEQNSKRLAVRNGRVALRFRPFEIKTLRFTRAG